MKKLYLSLLICLPLFAGAQITLTQSDLPVVNSGYINATDSNYVAAIPPGGNGQSWNYASLLNVVQDSLFFISPSGTPYASYFPSANLATYDPNSGFYGYFISNSTGFYVNGGFTNLASFPLVYNPPQMFIPVPFTNGNTYSGHSRLQIDTNITFPTRIVQYTIINIIADGYGSLTLPTGTFPNTLRLKTTSLEIDSFYVDFGLGYMPFGTPNQTQTTDFKWCRNGGGALLLDIAADSLGQTSTTSSYLLFYGALGIEENSNPVSIRVYPNPVSDKITFEFERQNDKTSLSIFNTMGQAIESHDITHLNTFSMRTNHLPTGMYSYVIQSEKEKTVGKFMVAH